MQIKSIVNRLPTQVNRSLLSITFWLALWFATQAVAGVPEVLTQFYLYESPLTKDFFAANGAAYDAIKDRWKSYLRRSTSSFKEVNRANLLTGLRPGVLVLASAVLLDDQEREAVNRFSASGGSVILTWGTGARNANGKWVGYGFLEKMMEMKVVGKVEFESNERFLNTFGDGPISWSLPAGERVFLGEIAETPIRVDSPNLAARYFDWQRAPTPKNSNGAVAFLEKNGSRRVYFGFSEASWDYDERLRLPKLIDGVMAWLQHIPTVSKAAWPNGRLSAQLLEMDTEAKFRNALNFAAELDKAQIRGTFYCLTSVAKDFRDVVQNLLQKHEIGYHADVHYGFKGKSIDNQKDRLDTMVSDMKGLVGSRVLPSLTGFRAPTESWDTNTEKLLRQIGVRHHVADPGSSESRLPFFSLSEPDLNADQAIVVLPRTQMDDLNYLGLKLDLEKASALIMLDFDYLHEAGALGILSVHSQNYGDDGLMARLTPPYVKLLEKYRQDVWAASGQEISDWWRERERVAFQSGPLIGGRFTFAVQAPGQVKGLSLVVTHPARDAVVKRVDAISANTPIPELVHLDAWRSVLIFRNELKVGSYSYSLTF